MFIREATKDDIMTVTKVSTASFQQEARSLRLPERDLNIEPPGYNHEAMTQYMI